MRLTQIRLGLHKSLLGMARAICVLSAASLAACSETEDSGSAAAEASAFQRRVDSALAEGPYLLRPVSVYPRVREQFEYTQRRVRGLKPEDLAEPDFSIAFVESPIRRDPETSILRVHWIGEETGVTHVRVWSDGGELLLPLDDLDQKLNKAEVEVTVVLGADWWLDHVSDEWKSLDQLSQSSDCMIELLMDGEQVGAPRELIRVRPSFILDDDGHGTIMLANRFGVDGSSAPFVALLATGDPSVDLYQVHFLEGGIRIVYQISGLWKNRTLAIVPDSLVVYSGDGASFSTPLGSLDVDDVFNEIDNLDPSKSVLDLVGSWLSQPEHEELDALIRDTESP